MERNGKRRIGRLAAILALGFLLMGLPLIAPPAAASVSGKESRSCCRCKGGCSAPCKERCDSTPKRVPGDEQAPAPSSPAPERDHQAAGAGEAAAVAALDYEAPRRARGTAGHGPLHGLASLFDRKTSFLC